jgi:hypothetical protein
MSLPVEMWWPHQTRASKWSGLIHGISWLNSLTTYSSHNKKNRWSRIHDLSPVMYIYIYVYMYIILYLYIYTYVYIYIWLCVCVIYIYTCILCVWLYMWNIWDEYGWIKSPSSPSSSTRETLQFSWVRGAWSGPDGIITQRFLRRKLKEIYEETSWYPLVI